MKKTKTNISEKSRTTALILALFVGILGVHRFYAGKPVTGVLQILTWGGLGIWTTIDAILIATGHFKDGKGRSIKNWEN